MKYDKSLCWSHPTACPPTLPVNEMLERLSIPRAAVEWLTGRTANWFMLMLWHSVISVMLPSQPDHHPTGDKNTKLLFPISLSPSLEYDLGQGARSLCFILLLIIIDSWYFSNKDLSGNNLSWEMINWFSKAAGYTSNIVSKI